MTGREQERLTWVGPPNPSACGCVWRRCEEYGDVIVEQCTEHWFQTQMELVHNAADARGEN